VKERLASALFGAVWGALIGGILSWLLGVYSQTLGTATIAIDARSWIEGTAILFALLGFLFNVGIGTIVGMVLNAIFQLESAEERSIFPGWVANALLIMASCVLIWVFVSN
jgi:hypothetical protein